MPECDTRTYVEDNRYLRWNAGDEITVFNGNSYNSHWQFAGEDGANSGKFNEIEENGFVTGTPLDLVANYAIYPYDENIAISEAGAVSLTLPAVQEYNHPYTNSFGAGANTMMSVTKNTSDNFLSFKNLCGYLKLKFYGDDVTVKSITVKGNNGEKIAGPASVTMEYGGEPVIAMGSDATDTITIDCGEGVALSNDAANPTTFWVVIPEITFEGGITIEVTDINDQTFSRQTTNVVPIENNLIQPMAALGVEVESETLPEETTPKPANNEIWYTATGVATLFSTSGFGANIVSNEWDSETGKGVITFDADVTTIGYEAFYRCIDLTSITIPEGVTRIDERAFYQCDRLESITIPSSVRSIGYRAFFTSGASKVYITNIAAWCNIYFDGIESSPFNRTRGSLYLNNELLTDLTIPDGVSSIGAFAFYGCTSLTSVTIPDSVTKIGEDAFTSCSRLTSVSIPNSVTSIGSYAFWCCTSLTSVTIGNSVTSIGYWAFCNCTSLTSVTIPDSVTSIGEKAFASCYNLTSITIPSSVTSIGESAFEGCYFKRGNFVNNSSLDAEQNGYWGAVLADMIQSDGLVIDDNIVISCRKNATSVTIPNGVTSIGDSAFSSCSSLTSITIPDSVTSIGYEAFYWCTSLTSVTIGNGVTSIGEYAFCWCDSLTSVTIGNGVTSIGNSAFYDCGKLTSITIPDGVTSIGQSAFSSCTSLTSVTIPDSVTSIGYGAFSGCTSLKEVYCKATTPPTGGSSMFYNNASGRKIYVPAQSVAAYKAASVWSGYASYIVGYDFVKGEVADGGNNGSYTVVLNNAWRKSTSVSNPNSSLYDGVNESYSNYNVHSASAWMYIDIEGYTEFTIYVRSYAESNYDYVTVYNLDSTSSAKMTTKGNQQSGTSISSYTPVTFSNIGEGSHRIAIEYKKDSSQNSNSDRGYVLIPKNQ